MSYSDLKGATEEKLNKLFAKKLETPSLRLKINEIKLTLKELKKESKDITKRILKQLRRL